MEVVLGDAAVFNVKNAFERLHVEQVHLLQVLQLQRDAAQLLPDQRGQVQVQGLLGPDGHAHQDAQKLELEHVLVQAGGRVEKEPGGSGGGVRPGGIIQIIQIISCCSSSPVSVVAHLCGGVGGGDEQVDHTCLQLL